MSQEINLKELEQRAYRSNFEDGLWDVFLGALLFQSVISWVLYEREWSPPTILMVMLGYVVVVLIAFTVAKKYIVTPRMGLVNFGTARKAKNKKLTLVLSLSCLLGVIVFAAVAAGYLAAENGGVSVDSPLIFAPFGLFAVMSVIVFSLGAYWLDYQRAYLYGWFFGLSAPLNIFLDEKFGISFPLATAVSSLIMVLIGVVLFIRFVQTHPMNEMEV